MTTPSPIREAVRTLQAQGHGLRAIARALKLSRNTVRRVLRAAPEPSSASSPEPVPVNLAELRSAFARAQGNVVRTQQLLAAEHELVIPYSTLTRWIREAGLREPPAPVGQYVFGPGQEMQHDTSPHRVSIDGRIVTAQCASLVLAYSRRLFVQYYRRYTRLEAREFLLEAVRFMGGACRRCVIDNTSVMVVAGAGEHAVIAPEMQAFGHTLGFEFRAHRVRDPDRKGRVERPFYWVEKNFLPARRFTDFDDLNRQALDWCQTVANVKPKRVLGMAPEAAWVMERPYLQALPAVLPPVYDIVDRVVDTSGYVSLDTHRYSVPQRLIGQAVTLYKYPREVRIEHRGRLVTTHRRILQGRDGRSTDPAHHLRPAPSDPSPGLEQQLLDSAALAAYAQALRQHGRGRAARALRRLLEIQRTYPREPFLAAVEQAAHYGLYDLGRLERLVLEEVAGNFFALAGDGDDNDGDSGDDHDKLA
ncbi:MAG: IS21 family transposase [Burkholderiaceae bacterium]